MRNTGTYYKVRVTNKEPQLRRSPRLNARGREHRTESEARKREVNNASKASEAGEKVMVADRVRMVDKASGRVCNLKKVVAISDNQSSMARSPDC